MDLYMEYIANYSVISCNCLVYNTSLLLALTDFNLFEKPKIDHS